MFGRLQSWFGNGAEGILTFLITTFCVLFSLGVHELSHGLMAYLRGDKTAKSMGRISVNPLRHLDPIGTICMFLFGFGWAKPVVVNPMNFNRKTIKFDMVLTSLAGPLSNFIIAFLSTFAAVAVAFFSDGVFMKGAEIMYFQDVASKYALLAIRLLSSLGFMNLGLGLFNLIPIPPLDGSKVLNAVLPTKYYFKLMRYEQYGFIILIIIINLPIVNELLTRCTSGVFDLFSLASLSVLGLFC